MVFPLHWMLWHIMMRAKFAPSRRLLLRLQHRYGRIRMMQEREA
jgi:hypothetical protein